ncbi:helix-turn-helix domain-containing protein [Thalassotalea litorea]|uniref:helix-turn-helix domain-containing protein n=1 Tax=Thalassotalea litorea TaxID=2020715 RepID=UPI0037367BB5
MFNLSEIGSCAVQKRKELSKSQTEMAGITGIKQSVISRIERGKFDGSLKIISKYLGALGLKLTVSSIEDDIPDFDELENFFKDDE